MHIECVKNNGVPYLRIAKSRFIKELGKQKKFVVKNLGPLSKYDDGIPDFLKRFREQFKNGEISFDDISYSNKSKPTFSFKIESTGLVYNNQIKLKNIGSIILERLYNELGLHAYLANVKSRSKITYDLNGLVKLLVFGRIMDPKSKVATFLSKDDYFYQVTSSDQLKDVYKTLDVLDDKSIGIQKRINTSISKTIGRDTSITYYDVTNYYFETM